LTTDCAVCGATSLRPKLEKDGIEILECRSCGLAFWVPDPDFRPESLYAADYFEGTGRGHGYGDYGSLEVALRANFSKRLGSAALRPGARLLDLGAAFGFGVSEAARAGFGAFGLELSRSAARRAAVAAPGAIVAANALRLPFGTASLEIVTLWDVLEHLPDPAAVLGEIARVLVPDGRLLLTTGDVGSLAARILGARWHLYTLPEHLFFFSRRSLRVLLEGAGFEIERMRAEFSVYPLGYVVERLRRTLLGRATAVPTWPGARLRVPLNLLDIVTVHAVKRGPRAEEAEAEEGAS